MGTFGDFGPLRFVGFGVFLVFAKMSVTPQFQVTIGSSKRLLGLG